MYTQHELLYRGQVTEADIISPQNPPYPDASGESLARLCIHPHDNQHGRYHGKVYMLYPLFRLTVLCPHALSSDDPHGSINDHTHMTARGPTGWIKFVQTGAGNVTNNLQGISLLSRPQQRPLIHSGKMIPETAIQFLDVKRNSGYAEGHSRETSASVESASRLEQAGAVSFIHCRFWRWRSGRDGGGVGLGEWEAIPSLSVGQVVWMGHGHQGSAVQLPRLVPFTHRASWTNGIRALPPCCSPVAAMPVVSMQALATVLAIFWVGYSTARNETESSISAVSPSTLRVSRTATLEPLLV